MTQGSLWNKKQKKTILIVIWCLLAAIVVGGGIWLWIYFSQFSSYQDSQYHFTVQYPSKWQKIEHYQGTAVAFIRPKETALDVVIPNVNITVQEVPAPIATLSSFSEMITKQMKAIFDKNITILEDKDVTFADRPSHRLIILASKPNNLKTMVVWTVKGSFAYIFTFLAREDQYKDLSSTIDRMVASFELK